MKKPNGHNITSNQTHERSTTQPRIFRPLFQTKDLPSLGRCSSMVRSHFAFRPFSTVSLALALVLALAFSFSFFSYLIMPSNVSAASNLTVTVANTISLNIMPNSASGTFAHSSTSANTVTVMTDNYTGYTLGIAASNANDNALSLKENNAVVDTIASHTNTSGVSESNYANDSYASLNSLNNTWGYRPSTYYDTANNTNVDNTSTNLYFPAPTSTSVNTLAKTTTANPSTADNYNIAIGARVGTDKTPGAYTNTLVLTVVANPTLYNLTYNANAGGDSTVANMPSNVASGISYADTITLSSTVPTRTGYTFAGWCATNTSQTSCSGTLYNSTNNNLDSFPIDRTASSNSLNAYAVWSINQYTCTKQYRLQNADGTWNSYTADGTEQVNYGATCNYSKSVTDYKNSASGTNNAQASTSCTITTSGCTASLDFYRNTYALTVSAGANTSSATGSGTYRWGQSVTVGVTKASNVTCTSYATPTWTATAGTAPSAGTSVSYTMPKSNTTVTATSTASNIAQTITLSKGTGVSGITIAGTNYTGTSVSLNCGTYSITGTYNSGYEFSSWARANGVAVTSTTSATTNMTVTGAGTLTLTGKSAVPGLCTDADHCMQVSTATCGNNMVDSRTGVSYLTATINNQCYMEQNLYLPTGKTLYPSDTNITRTSWTTPASSTIPSSSSYDTAYMVTGTHTDNTYNATGGWYNYCAASAGTVCNNTTAQNASEDICPAGWRLLNYDEMTNVKNANRSNWKFYAGYYDGGSLKYDTSRSHWWSDTALNQYSQYNLYYRNSLIITYDQKTYGCFVRCVRK